MARVRFSHSTPYVAHIRFLDSVPYITKKSRTFSICQKIPENSGNFGGKCLSVKNVFHLTRVPSIPRLPSLSDIFRTENKKKMAPQLLSLNITVVLSLEQESVVNSKNDDDIAILAVVTTYMRRDLHQNQEIYENSFQRYTIDEFKSHSRLT